MNPFIVRLRDLETREQEIDTGVPLLSADGHGPHEDGPSPTGADTGHLGIDLKSPIRCRLTVGKHGEVITAKGRLEFDYERPCDRCGQPVPLHLREKIDFLLRREHAQKPPSEDSKGGGKKRGRRAEPEPPPVEDEPDDSHRLSAADLDDMTYRGEEIDFEPHLYELAALGIPMRTACENAGRTCVVDPDTYTREKQKGDDPRWAVLKQLKKK